MSKLKLAPGKIAHYYALMAWNGKSSIEALETVVFNTYEKLDGMTYASGSVNNAKAGIEKYLLKSGTLDLAYITGEKEDENYFANAGQVVANNFASEEELCDAIVKILAEIHDGWVAGNAKKYNRDAEKNDKRLFQHLPTALIGLEEVAKDLMFLAPILEQMGYSVGKMTEQEWGAFVTSDAVAKAYDRYVEEYKKENNIYSQEDLENHLKTITETYPALKDVGGVSSERVAYIKERVKLLAGQVAAKNPNAFSKDQSQPS